MNRQSLIIRGVILIFIGVILLIFQIYRLKGDNDDTIKDKIQIIVNENILDVELENNSSTKEFIKKLKEKDLIIEMHDYGNFEKVGDLGFTLTKNDRNLRAEAGDLILYQGNQITLYYDTNSWTLTKLGHVNKTKEELLDILGEGDVTMTFTIVMEE